MRLRHRSPGAECDARYSVGATAEGLAGSGHDANGRTLPSVLTSSRVLAGLGILLALFSIADLQGGLVALAPVRVAAPLAGLALIAAACARRSALRRHDLLVLMATGSALGWGLAVWPLLKSGPDLYSSARRFAIVALAWAIGLLLMGDEAGASGGRRWPLPRRWALLGIILLAFAGAVVSHRVGEERYTTINDENLYLLQSRLFEARGFGRPIAKSEEPFFLLAQAAIRDGRLRTQYPPGWPYLLELFHRMGLRDWCGAILLAVAVGFVYLLGCRVHSPIAGLTAAALLGTSPLVLRYSGTYMAHTASLACIVPAAWLLLRGEQQGGPGRLASWLWSGVLLGVAFAIRPLTGALIGLSLLLWLLARRRIDPARVAVAVVVVSVGALPLLAATFRYNTITTGHPLTFGYEAVNGHLHDFGFGPRGFVRYDPLGRPYAQVRGFSLRIAVDHTIDRGWDLVSLAMPAFLLPTLLLLAVYYRYRVNWRQTAVFLALPVGHFAYFYTEPRFYIELLPFLFVGAGVLVGQFVGRQPRSALVVLIVALLGNLGLAAGQLRRSPLIASTLGVFHDIDAAQREYSRLLVFVSEAGPYQLYWYNVLYLYNVDAFPGPVVVVRDLGDRNADLIRRYADRVPMRLVDRGPNDVPKLVPYAAATGEAAGSTR